MRENPTALWSRASAALLGGYVVANTLAISLSVWIPMTRDDAVIVGMMSTFALYTAAIVWSFSAKTATRAWLGLLSAGLISLALWWSGAQL